MQPGFEATRSLEEDLEDLDETHRAIALTEKRLDSQKRRIAQLKEDGIECHSAEKMLADMHRSLKDLIRHRALVIQAIFVNQRP